MELENQQALFASKIDDMTRSSLETLSPELFSHILSFIDPYDLHTLNSLGKTSRTLYHLTIPALYHSFSYHGMQQDIKHLRRFLETLNWRQDLAAHVRELDLREWGNCPRLEDYVGMMDEEQYEMREKEKEAKKKEMEKGTLMDDELLGDEGDAADVEDETYEEEEEEEEVDWNEDSEDEIGVDGDEDGIPSEELEFLGPLLPFNHDDCLQGQCKNGTGKSLKREGRDLGFERENILLDYWKIWKEESDEESKDKNENELVVLLLSRCQNLRTLYMVMPEVYFDWSYQKNTFCQFLDDNSGLAASGALQRLETLYICSPMYPGGKDHRQYELDFRRSLPFMRLPNLKSLYTLTAYIYWDNWPNPPIDYTPLKHTSNITTLTYDECALTPYDVSQSLSIFHSLTSFRWTTSPTCFCAGDSFVGFQCDFGKALLAHKDTLEDLYFDSRHPQIYKLDRTTRAEPTAIMIGSLQGYSKLRTVAIDVTSLVGHQNWTFSDLPLVDVLPPNLEELTLFVKVHQERDHEVNAMVIEMVFDNNFFYPAFLTMLRSARNRLPELRRIRIELTHDIVYSRGRPVPGNIVISEAKFEEAKVLCVEGGIEIDIRVAVEWNEHEMREAGNTDVSFFQEQIRGRNPGRDW